MVLMKIFLIGLSVCLSAFVATSEVFAETVIPFRGTFESSEDSRYFTDIGRYSVFDDIVTGNGEVIWVPSTD